MTINSQLKCIAAARANLRVLAEAGHASEIAPNCFTMKAELTFGGTDDKPSKFGVPVRNASVLVRLDLNDRSKMTIAATLNPGSADELVLPEAPLDVLGGIVPTDLDVLGVIAQHGAIRVGKGSGPDSAYMLVTVFGNGENAPYMAA